MTSRSWQRALAARAPGHARPTSSSTWAGAGWSWARPSPTCAASSTRCAPRRAGERDICIYPRDPHVLVGLAPDELFIDPSYTYRLDLHRYRPRPELIRDVFVRTATSRADMEAINEIYALNGMVLGDADVMWAQPPHARLHLPGRRGLAHRADHRHGHRGRPRARLRRPGGAAPACGAWPCTTRTPRPAPVRRWCGCWPSATSAGAGPTSTSRSCTTTRRHPALPQARLHPGPGGLRQAQEPDQHPAVRRAAARARGAQPLRADHRRGGAAAGHPRSR